MEFNTPQSLKLEHEELHAELTMATQVSGKGCIKKENNLKLKRIE